MVNSAIFAAADLSTLSSNVSAVVIGFVGVSLAFVAYRYLRKAGVK